MAPQAAAIRRLLRRRTVGRGARLGQCAATGRDARSGAPIVVCAVDVRQHHRDHQNAVSQSRPHLPPAASPRPIRPGPTLRAMSTFDFTPEPDQRFHSPLGLPPGSPGPLGIAAEEPGAPPDLGGAPLGAGPPPPPPDSEVDILKSMLVTSRLPRFAVRRRGRAVGDGTRDDDSPKAAREDQRMADQATGTSPATRKLLDG